MKRAIVLAIFASIASVAWGAAPDVSGNWTVHQSVAGNESDMKCKLALAGKDVSGSCKMDAGDVQGDFKVTGTFENGHLTFKFTSDYNGTPLTNTYTAKVDNADKFTGEVAVDPFGVNGDFTATRAKE